ncbi:MAG: PIN domain-containing protein [Nitrospinae bacterium]|nr:PIN domain-containing protein [Nitrospinota bacterium]MBI3813226.1 PIN domain-containing protein [Nitrospinota bacterium]
MKYLADTVTIIRHFSETGSIGKRVISILDDTEQGKNHLYISVISIVEIMYLSEKRRIKINLAETLNIINNSANYSIVDLTPNIVIIAKNIKFPELHDRLIIATAKFLEIPILTSDKEIYKIDGIKVIWS